MLLPNFESAFIDTRKLSDYSLDSTHPVGRHKAFVFRSSLGLSVEDVVFLQDLLLQSITLHNAFVGRLDEFGQRYTVDFPVTTKRGSAILRSAWIIRSDEDFPRLTTCFVLPQ